MNFDLIESNSTLLNRFYSNIESTWLNDTIYLTLTPINIISLIMNSICYLVFRQINEKTTQLYHYFRVYSLNTCLMSFIGVFASFPFAHQYFKLTGNYYISIYKCIILQYVCVNFYFFGNVLDVLICLERLSNFIKSYKKYLQRFVSSPYLIVTGAFIFCIIVNLSLYFWFLPKTEDEFYRNALNLDNQTRFTHCIRTNFLDTTHGLILSIISIFIRDALTFILEITLSILMIIHLNSFLKRKRNTQHHYSITNEAEICMRMTTRRTSSIISQQIHNIRYQRNLAMVICVSIFSLVTHSLTLIMFSINIYETKSNIKIIPFKFFFGTFFVSLKNCSNIFIFYKFNLKFKRLISKFFSK